MGIQVKHGCCQAVQEGGQCHSGDLEDACTCGAEVWEAGCAGKDEVGLSAH